MDIKKTETSRNKHDLKSEITAQLLVAQIRAGKLDLLEYPVPVINKLVGRCCGIAEEIVKESETFTTITRNET